MGKRGEVSRGTGGDGGANWREFVLAALRRRARAGASVRGERARTSPRKVRLLCVGRDLSGGGAERIQLTLLERLSRERFDIDVFYLSDRGVLHGLIPRDLVPTYGASEGESLRRRLVPVLVRLFRLALRSDVIFAMQGGTPIYLAALVGRLTGRPVVGWVHVNWSQALRYSRPWHRRAFFLHSLADRLIGVSEGVAEDLEGLSPRLKGKVIALRNPLSLRRLRTQAAAPLPAWADRIFAKRTLLAMGRLTPQKGFDVLLPAFAKLVDQGLDLHLLVLGEGGERQRLRTIARDLGVDDRVFMPGFQENPYPFFEHAEAFVLSSRYEGLGMVILEAMALGLPVIATDCPHGPRELTCGGRYGVLVPPNDVDTLARVMYDLAGSSEERARFGAAGLGQAERYDVDRVKSSFEDVFLGCVRGRSIDR